MLSKADGRNNNSVVQYRFFSCGVCIVEGTLDFILAVFILRISYNELGTRFPKYVMKIYYQRRSTSAKQVIKKKQ
jgi:hypothetical protein